METSSVMEFTVEAAGPCRKKVSVTIPREMVEAEFKKSYQNWTKTVPIAGFRPGKAPRKLVEKRFGEQVVVEVKQSLVDAAFEAALEKNDLSPIADPELDLEQIAPDASSPLAFDFTVTVKPEFELPDLKSIEVAVPEADPTPEQIEKATDALRRRKATLRPVKGKAAEGDVVSLKMRGTHEETEVVHHDDLAYEIGSRYLGGLIAEGLDEALTGAAAGAHVEGKAYAPPQEENHPLAGLEVSIHAEVLDVKRPELPALDDALAKAFDFDSQSELLEAVTKDVRAHNEQEREKAIEELALAQIIEKSAFDLPEQLIAAEVEELARRAAYEMQMQNKPEAEIARAVAEIRARRAEESARELKSFFVLDKIVDAERILVTETEVKSAVALLGQYNEKTPEQMYAILRESNRLGSLRNQLRVKKARARLREKARVTTADAPKKKTAVKKATKKKATKKKES